MLKQNQRCLRTTDVEHGDLRTYSPLSPEIQNQRVRSLSLAISSRRVAKQRQGETIGQVRWKHTLNMAKPAAISNRTNILVQFR